MGYFSECSLLVKLEPQFSPQRLPVPSQRLTIRGVLSMPEKESSVRRIPRRAHVLWLCRIVLFLWSLACRRSIPCLGPGDVPMAHQTPVGSDVFKRFDRHSAVRSALAVVSFAKIMLNVCRLNDKFLTGVVFLLARSSGLCH